MIVQFGDCHTAASGTPDGDRVKELLDEYMKMFQVRNPNLYVFNAVLHDDEASPHLHIDFNPLLHARSQDWIVERCVDACGIAGDGLFAKKRSGESSGRKGRS